MNLCQSDDARYGTRWYFYRVNADGSTTYYFAEDIDIDYDERGQPIKALLNQDGQPVTIGKIEKCPSQKQWRRSTAHSSR